MNKYQQGKIYKIIDNTSKKVYIGSTCLKLNKRLTIHKSDFNRFKENKFHFLTSFQIIENGDFIIELIKNFPCEHKLELEQQEGITINQYKKDGFEVVNKCIGGKSRKEYYQENNENIKKNVAIYRNKNKEKNNEKFICCCGGRYSFINKSSHEKTKKHNDFLKPN